MPRIDHSRIDRFIEAWHRGTWSVDALPLELGAYCVELDLPGRILGVSQITRRKPPVIGISAPLAGTDYYTTVLNHECAHILDGRPGDFTCEAGSKHERRIWRIAARLALPESVCQAIRSGVQCASSVARLYCLPLAFVRYAAHGDVLFADWIEDIKAHASIRVG